jgi:hypothetical protein
MLMKMAAQLLSQAPDEKDFSAREKELLDHIADLHKEIMRYESYMDWGDEDLGEFPHLLPK